MRRAVEIPRLVCNQAAHWSGSVAIALEVVEYGLGLG